jgi:hypothetical protein
MPAGDKHARPFPDKMLGDAGAAASDDSDFAELLAGHRDFLSQWAAAP